MISFMHEPGEPDHYALQHRDPIASISKRSIRLLWIAFVIIAALFAEEIVHYLQSTHLAALDTTPRVTATQHLQCSELGSTYSLRCPLPGFNSVTMICWESECYYGDPDLSPVTQQMREAHAWERHANALNSLQVESPYSSHSEEWHRFANSLETGTSDQVHVELPLDQRALTIPDAQALVNERSQAVSRQLAKDWMHHHGY